jgi:hypothetical protein
MRYRLDELATLAAELGLGCRRIHADRLDADLGEMAVQFCNLPGGETLVGFDGTPWHAHGAVQLSTGDASYIECDELEVLLMLAAGELVVISQFCDGKLRDRWISHREEGLALRYMRAGEELRVLRPRAENQRRDTG